MQHHGNLFALRVALVGSCVPLLLGLGWAPQEVSAKPDGLAQVWRFLDRDGDGLVGRYEGAEAWLLLAEVADAAGDGALGQAQLLAFLEEQRADELAERTEMFAGLDADGDGRVELRELAGELRGMLAGADGNADGVLELAEVLAFDDSKFLESMLEAELLAFLEGVDGDGDGAFALEDLPGAEREEFRDEFVALDVDANGLVTTDELFALIEEELRGAVFEVHGSVAEMTGVIGPSTPGRVLELILEHPEVETIAMLEVPGSMDDEANLRAARLVRRMGLATHVPSGGEVASGGTDFFLAGARRSAGPRARFGVHSWAGMNVEGTDVPRDDPEHDKYLDFYAAMGIPAEFYWYTLEAAPADGIHWMTGEELERFGMLTAAARQGQRDGSYGLDGIEVAAQGRGVVPLPESVDPVLRETFDRYARVRAPSGRPIHILAQASWSEDQIVHVRKVLEHLLTDAPGTEYGAHKAPVAEAMAQRRATMVLFDHIDDMERAFDGAMRRVGLSMQDLRANECTPPGSRDYLEHGTRDATFEEVLHLVHDYGLRPATPEYDALLEEANLRAAAAGIWTAWPADEPDSHRNEYIAAIYDNYLDLWTVPPTLYEGERIGPGDVPAGTSHFGQYSGGSRARLAELDPEGLALVELYFPPALTYTAELPLDFEGTFHIDHQPELRYTTKSQHLRHVSLRGERAAALVGNDHANTLTGNAGDNALQGLGGDDHLVGGAGVDEAVFSGARAEYRISGVDDLVSVADSVSGRDGTDTLLGVERLRFADGVIDSPR